MSNTVLATLIGQAPSRPKWFKGEARYTPPVLPDETIAAYKDHKEVNHLLQRWLKNPVWDLANTYIHPEDIPKGTDFATLQKELAKFEQEWNTYFKQYSDYHNKNEMNLDIQWKIYWAMSAYDELVAAVGEEI